jgi:hypothetical protein
MKNLSVKSTTIPSESIHDRRLAIQKSWTDDERIDRLQRAIKIQEKLAALLSFGQEKSALGHRSLELAS